MMDFSEIRDESWEFRDVTDWITFVGREVLFKLPLNDGYYYYETIPTEDVTGADPWIAGNITPTSSWDWANAIGHYRVCARVCVRVVGGQKHGWIWFRVADLYDFHENPDSGKTSMAKESARNGQAWEYMQYADGNWDIEFNKAGQDRFMSSRPMPWWTSPLVLPGLWILLWLCTRGPSRQP